MKRVISRSLPIACLLIAGLSLSAVAQPAAPAAPASVAVTPTGTTKVAVINFEAAVFQTNEGKRSIADIQKKFEPKREQLKTESDEVNTLKKQLQTAGDKLSDSERQGRTQAIDAKEKILQRDGEDASQDYQQQMQAAYQQLAEKVFGVLQSYASENGFGVVLDSSASSQAPPAVLWHKQSTDITKAVIDAYNIKSGIAAPAPAVPSAPTSHIPSHK
ncbi:MAG: OmpH family outer membrane protein [Acidobacteriaceae bacterium]